jgi:hypothetical protein
MTPSGALYPLVAVLVQPLNWLLSTHFRPLGIAPHSRSATASSQLATIGKDGCRSGGILSVGSMCPDPSLVEFAHSGWRPELKFKLYEKDGAVFRVKLGFVGVSDVKWPDGKWHEYEGDPLAPVFFGDYLGEEEMSDIRIPAPKAPKD